MTPTANSIAEIPSRGGMTTPNRMIAAPTVMTMTVCPTPQAAPIRAEPATLRSRLTMVAMATTWSASVACRIPRKKPRSRKNTTFRVISVMALVSRSFSRCIMLRFNSTPIPILRQQAFSVFDSAEQQQKKAFDCDRVQVCTS